MQYVRKNLFIVSAAMTGFVFALGITVYANYAAPTAVPPEDNAAAPLNVGDDTQFKDAGLALNSGPLKKVGLTLQGRLGVNVSQSNNYDPSAFESGIEMLRVEGYIGAGGVTYPGNVAVDGKIWSAKFEPLGGDYDYSKPKIETFLDLSACFDSGCPHAGRDIIMGADSHMRFILDSDASGGSHIFEIGKKGEFNAATGVWDEDHPVSSGCTATNCDYSPVFRIETGHRDDPARVGINTDSPNGALDIEGKMNGDVSGGLVLPNLTTSERDGDWTWRSAGTVIPAGTVIYNETTRRIEAYLDVNGDGIYQWETL